MSSIGEAAYANVGILASQAQAVLAVEPTLPALAELVDAAVPSTNVGIDKVERFHRRGVILDSRSLAIDRAGGNRAAGLAAFAKDRWSIQRQAFEDLWVGGDALIYFTPNRRTKGAVAFGDYCLVINSRRVVNERSAVFPRNTAKYYADTDGNVDAALAFAEVSLWESRADAAVVHLRAEVADIPEHEWSDFICGGLHSEEYMEVVTVGPVDLEDVLFLQMSKESKDEHDSYWWDWKEGKLIDPVKIRKAAAYDALMKWPNLQLRIV